MQETASILLSKYNEQCIQARCKRKIRTSTRQHESLRTSLVTFITAAAGAILSFSGAKEIWIEFQLSASFFLVILGMFAAFMSYKHYERFCYHLMLRNEFDRRLRSISEKVIDLENYDELLKSHKIRFGWVADARTYIGWILFPLMISCLGGVLFVLRLNG